MDKHDFTCISIRGMVAYCVMCLESYVLEAYVDRDLTPVLRLAWGIVGPEGYIDQNADRYMEAIPEYLFEFDDYGAAGFDAQELRKTDRHYQDDAIGIVVPLFEFDLPDVVDRFIATSTFDTDYFFIVSTFGMHRGGIAERASKRLEAAGRRVDYYNTVIMVDNAIQVFDMEEQMRIDPEKHVDEQLEAVRADIAARRHYIQPATQEEVDFYEGYMANPAFDLHPRLDNPLYRLTDACIGCGTCSRVCPMRSITMEDNRPSWDYTTCAGCYACVHACPKAAIRFTKYEEPNPEVHYRNPHVTLADLMRAAG